MAEYKTVTDDGAVVTVEILVVSVGALAVVVVALLTMSFFLKVWSVSCCS